MAGIEWVAVSCTVANVIAGAPEIVISRGRTDVTEGAFREYSTADGEPVLREWTRSPSVTSCLHEVPTKTTKEG